MNKIRVCPKCGNIDLKNINLLSAEEMAILKFQGAGNNPESFLCKKCNYFGPCPEIRKIDFNLFKSKIKSKE